MNKKVMKVLAILLLAVMVVSTFSPLVFAETDEIKASDFNRKLDDTSKEKITNFTGTLIAGARYIGFGVAILMLIILAIKYISAAPSEKAEIKKSAVIYVTGAILLFAASGVLTVIQSLAEQLTDK